MEALNTIAVDLFKKIAREAGELCEHGEKKVLNQQAIEAGTRMVLPPGLIPYAIYEGRRACSQFSMHESNLAKHIPVNKE